MNILNNQQEWPASGKINKQRDQHREQSLSVWIFLPIVATRGRTHQEIGDQRHTFGEMIRRAIEQCVQLSGPACRKVVVAKPGCVFELTNHRM